MAQRLLTFVLLVVLPTLACAQEVLTTNYFPAPGDTLFTNAATAEYVAEQEFFLEGGADLTWTFEDPTVLFSSANPVSVPVDDRFPTADLVITEDVVTQNYLRVDGDVLNLVGVLSRLEVLPSFELVAPVDPVRPLRRAGLLIGSELLSETENSVTVSPDSLPAEALALIGTEVLATVDSMRITTLSTRQDSVDAYGTVVLDGTPYSTIRERRREFIYIRLELKRGRLPFIDVTETIQVVEPSLGRFLGEQDTIDTYFWWNNDSKEAIAEVSVDTEGEAVSMRYKRTPQSTSTRGPGLTQAEIKLYPNPATALVNYEVSKLARGRYQLAVVNMLGQRVVRREFNAFGDQTRLTLDLGGLRGGQYLVSLTNERGRIISTRKLLVR